MDTKKLIDVLTNAVEECTKKAQDAKDASLRLTGQKDAYQDILNFIKSEEKNNEEDVPTEESEIVE